MFFIDSKIIKIQYCYEGLNLAFTKKYMLRATKIIILIIDYFKFRFRLYK